MTVWDQVSSSRIRKKKSRFEQYLLSKKFCCETDQNTISSFLFSKITFFMLVQFSAVDGIHAVD